MANNDDQVEGDAMAVIDRPAAVSPQGRSRTAVVVIALVVIAVIGAIFFGLRYSEPGGGLLVVPGNAQQ